jgi:hypothetical protein
LTRTYAPSCPRRTQSHSSGARFRANLTARLAKLLVHALTFRAPSCGACRCGDLNIAPDSSHDLFPSASFFTSLHGDAPVDHRGLPGVTPVEQARACRPMPMDAGMRSAQVETMV